MINGEGSMVVKVTSIVPHDFVRGPHLFLVFINNLDQGLEEICISKFFDNTKKGFLSEEKWIG
jgi:hypothetical protein